MSAVTMVDSAPRPTRVIAEALVERQSPRQIVARASTLGLSRQVTQLVLAVCCTTPADSRRVPHRRAAATT